MLGFRMLRRWKSWCLKLAALGVLVVANVEVLRSQTFCETPIHAENRQQPSTVTEDFPQLPIHIDNHTEPPTHTENHPLYPNNTEKHPQPPPHSNFKNHPQTPTHTKRFPQPPIHTEKHIKPSIHTANYSQLPTHIEKRPQPPTRTNIKDHPQPLTHTKKHPPPPIHKNNQPRPPTHTDSLSRRRQDMAKVMWEYPLSVNLSAVVDRIVNGESPQVEPVHNTTKYSYIINPVHTCRDPTVTSGSSIFLLVLVKSKFNHFKNRDVIRRTWGNESLVMGLTRTRLKTVFLLGDVPETLPGRSDMRDQLKAESLQYGDLVQQDFMDGYYNNTLKMKMGYHWALTFCPSAEFLAFLDDDYFVDTPNLIKALRTNISRGEYSHVVAGFVLWYDSVKCHPANKWYISPSEYRYNTYPPFAIAGSVFLHRSAARRLFTGMRFTKPFKLDDVYLGITAWKLGIEMRRWHGVHQHPVRYNAAKYRDVIAIHGYGNMTDVLRLWEMKYG